MEARTKTIENWFSLIDQGLITLPRFQRFEAWRPSQVQGVLENILRNPSLPIGALLVLEVGNEELFNSRPISGAPDPKSKPMINLLDGQQRLTALWRALHDDYEETTFFISLDDADRPEVQLVRRYTSKAGKRMPLWADNPTETYDRRLFPASLLCPGERGKRSMEAWTQEAGVDTGHLLQINEIRHRLATYAIPFLSLPTDTEPETALDVFINMNTSASPLKDFDIVVAQLEGAVGDSLHDMTDELRQEVPNAQEYGKMEDLALSVGALLNDKPPLKRTYLHRDFGKELAKVWPDVIAGIRRGVAFLREEEKIFNEKLLPTEVIAYLTAGLWAHVPQDGADNEGRARQLIRKTIWRASFTDRYFKTATTRAFADYKAIRNLLNNPHAGDSPELFDADQNPVATKAELYQGGWPARKDRLGRAILAVSLYGGGRDFADGSIISANNVRSREYHHVVPKSIAQHEAPEHRVDSALNCALISWRTNRTISAKTPEDYLRDRADKAGITMDQVRQRLESHLIPYDELVSGDFGGYLEARAEKVEKYMKTLCEGDIPALNYA